MAKERQNPITERREREKAEELKAFKNRAAYLRKKYRSKDNTGAEAGKAILYAAIYSYYATRANLPNTELFTEEENEAIRQSIRTNEELFTFCAYNNVNSWAIQTLYTATAQRRTLNAAVAHFYTIIADAIAAAEAKRALEEDNAYNDNVSLWLMPISIEHEEFTLLNLRYLIASSLRYLKAYQIALHIVGNATGVKEFEERYSLPLEETAEKVERLNEAIKSLSNTINKPIFSQDVLTPVSMEVEPPAEAKIKMVQKYAKGLKGFYYNGSTANFMNYLVEGYWL